MWYYLYPVFIVSSCSVVSSQHLARREINIHAPFSGVPSGMPGRAVKVHLNKAACTQILVTNEMPDRFLRPQAHVSLYQLDRIKLLEVLLLVISETGYNALRLRHT